MCLSFCYGRIISFRDMHQVELRLKLTFSGGCCGASSRFNLNWADCLTWNPSGEEFNWHLLRSTVSHRTGNTKTRMFNTDTYQKCEASAEAVYGTLGL